MPSMNLVQNPAAQMCLASNRVHFNSKKDSLVALFTAAAVCALMPAAGAFAQAESATPQATPVPSEASPAATPENATDKPNETNRLDSALDKAEPKENVYLSAGGEGKTLPENVLRVRLPFRFASATQGFNSSGKKLDQGLDLSIVGSGLVAEYGVTEDLSVQFLLPVVLQNKLGLNADKFRKSDAYNDNYLKFVKTAAGLLFSKGLCRSVEACVTDILAGSSLPADTAIPLPSGETLQVKAGVPIRQYSDTLVVNAIAPTSGKTGLGDVEIGALYSVLSERGPYTNIPVFVSLGGGLRLPTGSFADVPSSQRSTGRGTLDLGLRSNVDYNPLPGVFLAWQNQLELMLAKGKKKKSSLLDGSKLNDADPTTATAVATGSNGKGNEQTFERRGARNVGFVKVSWGVANVIPVLEPIGLNAQYKYDFDSAEYLDGIAQGPRRQAYNVSAGGSIDLLAYKIPAQFDVDYEFPVSGKNSALAASILSVTLKGYYKF